MYGVNCQTVDQTELRQINGGAFQRQTAVFVDYELTNEIRKFLIVDRTPPELRGPGPYQISNGL